MLHLQRHGPCRPRRFSGPGWAGGTAEACRVAWQGLRWGLLLLAGLGLAPNRGVAGGPGDSVGDLAGGRGHLRPVARIAAERIDECSGIVWLDGAYFVHNDSGDEPVLYRSPELDFAQPEILPLAGAEAVDWEDITVFESDLLIGDIGDNRCARDHLVLYRARYRPAAQRGRSTPGDCAAGRRPEETSGAMGGRLELVAAYPFRYPDAPHDAEALATIDGRVHLITKARGDSVTHVYAFEELFDDSLLGPDGFNTPRLVADLTMNPGEQVTAADFEPDSRTLVLLTYMRLLRYPQAGIQGVPAAATQIEARQCEALCFHDQRLVFTNEQRDVFVIDDFLARSYESLSPARD